MTYNFLFVTTDVKNQNSIYLRRIFEKISETFNKSFNLQICVATESETLRTAKSAHAVLIDKNINEQTLHALTKELALHTQIRKIGNIYIVNDAFCGIYSHEKGFRINPAYGREAFDTECFSELEIERTARIAYELTPTRHITLIDKADKLATSKLWRKIVTDINEDYPFVNVEMSYIDDFFKNICERDTLLTTNLFGDIIASYLNSRDGEQEYCAFAGDTALAVSKIGGDLKSAVAFLFRHSLDMTEISDYLVLDSM